MVRPGAGLVVEVEERFTFRVPPLDPPKSQILGRARRPAAEAPELRA